jgi:hypothetical protein
VAAHLHGDPLRHTGPDHVADGSAAQVVEELAREPRSLAGTIPGVLESLETSGGLMKYTGVTESPSMPPPLNQGTKGCR